MVWGDVQAERGGQSTRELGVLRDQGTGVFLTASSRGRGQGLAARRTRSSGMSLADALVLFQRSEQGYCLSLVEATHGHNRDRVLVHGSSRSRSRVMSMVSRYLGDGAFHLGVLRGRGHEGSRRRGRAGGVVKPMPAQVEDIVDVDVRIAWQAELRRSETLFQSAACSRGSGRGRPQGRSERKSRRVTRSSLQVASKEGEPSSTSRCMVRPTSCGRWFGCRPRPGDFTATSASVTTSPLSNVAATRDLARFTRFISSPVDTSRGDVEPIAASTSQSAG